VVDELLLDQKSKFPLNGAAQHLRGWAIPAASLLGDLGPEEQIVTRQHDFHTLFVAESIVMIRIEVTHDELAVLVTKLCYTILSQEVIDLGTCDVFSI